MHILRTVMHTRARTHIDCDGSVLHSIAACAQLLPTQGPAPAPVAAMPSPSKRAQRQRAPSPSRKRPRLRLASCARGGKASWRTLVDREQQSLYDALSRRSAKIQDLEAEIATEKRYSDRLRQERKDSPTFSMGTASVTTAIEICHIHPKLSPSLSFVNQKSASSSTVT